MEAEIEAAAERLRVARAEIPTTGRLPTQPPQLQMELRIMVATDRGCPKFDLVYNKQCRELELEAQRLQRVLDELKLGGRVLSALAWEGERLTTTYARQRTRLNTQLVEFREACEDLIIRCFELRRPQVGPAPEMPGDTPVKKPRPRRKKVAAK